MHFSSTLDADIGTPESLDPIDSVHVRACGCKGLLIAPKTDDLAFIASASDTYTEHLTTWGRAPTTAPAPASGRARASLGGLSVPRQTTILKVASIKKFSVSSIGKLVWPTTPDAATQVRFRDTPYSFAHQFSSFARVRFPVAPLHYADYDTC